MTVAWTDFLLIAAVVKELSDAIGYFKSRGKKHDVVQNAAEKYREALKNPVLANLMEHARSGSKLRNHSVIIFRSRITQNLSKL